MFERYLKDLFELVYFKIKFHVFYKITSFSFIYLYLFEQVNVEV